MVANQMVFAKHDGCEKEYLFAVPHWLSVKEGDILLVNTRRGESVATATSDMFTVSKANEVAVRFGAHIPLKEVKQVVGKTLQTYIIQKERQEIIDYFKRLHSDRLPF